MHINEYKLLKIIIHNLYIFLDIKINQTTLLRLNFGLFI